MYQAQQKDDIIPTNTPHIFHDRFHVVSMWNTRGVFVGIHNPQDDILKHSSEFDSNLKVVTLY